MTIPTDTVSIEECETCELMDTSFRVAFIQRSEALRSPSIPTNEVRVSHSAALASYHAALEPLRGAESPRPLICFGLSAPSIGSIWDAYAWWCGCARGGESC